MNAVVICANCSNRRIEAQIESDAFNNNFEEFVKTYSNLSDSYMRHDINETGNIYRYFEGCDECTKSIINDFLIGKHSFSYTSYKIDKNLTDL